MAGPRAPQPPSAPPAPWPGPPYPGYPPYPPYPPPRSDGSKVVLIVVAVVVVVILVTVVLAAILYVMVSGLLTGPGGGPQVIGVVVGRSSDGANWTLTVSSTPSGKALSSTTLVIKSAGGDIALTSAALSPYFTETNDVRYVRVSGTATNIGVGDVVLMDTTTYPQGYRYEISDGTTLLASGELR